MAESRAETGPDPVRAGDRHVVRVSAMPAPSVGYDVVIGRGVLDELPARIAAAAPAARYTVIAPDCVARLYAERVLDGLRSAGMHAVLLEFADGEAHKTRETWADLSDRMLAHGFGRDSGIVALGGGVAGDVAGFVAATYMRGIPVVHVPTTLLAMIDASVGGKTGVDTSAGKNLLGAFHAPALVLADPLVLATLPPAQLRAGLAEAVKHGAILDGDYFAWIEAGASSLLALDPDALAELVRGSVRLKARIVAEDPYERGRRALLNFGHTIGHALELQAGWSMLHGHAVAMGMVAEAALGVEAGITDPAVHARVRALLERLELPVRPPAADVAAILEAIRLDKKARHSRPRFALPDVIGTAARPDDDNGWTFELPDALIERVLAAVFHGGTAV